MFLLIHIALVVSLACVPGILGVGACLVLEKGLNARKERPSLGLRLACLAAPVLTVAAYTLAGLAWCHPPRDELALGIAIIAGIFSATLGLVVGLVGRVLMVIRC